MPPALKVIAPREVEEGDVIIAIDGEPTTHMRVIHKTQHYQSAEFECRAHYNGRRLSARAGALQTITVVREEP